MAVALDARRRRPPSAQQAHDARRPVAGAVDPRGEPGRDLDEGAGPQAAARPGEGLPQVSPPTRPHEQELCGPPPPGGVPEQARGEDAAAVEDQQVAGPQELRQLAEAVVRQRAASAGRA